jgi:hypothetical protein
MPNVTGSNNQASTNDSSKESRVVVDKVVGHLKEMRRLEGELQSVLAASHKRLMAFAPDESGDSIAEEQSASENESLASFSRR